MSTAINAMRTGPRRVVHLELHTGDQARAGAFYAELLQWRPELVRGGSGCYLALDLGPAVGRGDHRVPDAASAVAAVRRGRADRRCDRARPRARRGGAARTAGGAVGLAKCRVQPGRRGGGRVGAEAMTGEHGLLDAARDGGQDAFARLAGAYPAQPRACCHRMLRPHFARDTERWISGPTRISTSKATDPSD